MKAKKQNISVRELFRNNLEYAEVIPDRDIRAKLMHRVARQEFMHFNLSSLNIFYVGGLLFAGIAAAFLLFSGSGKSDLLSDSSNYLRENGHDTVSYFQIPAARPEIAMKVTAGLPAGKSSGIVKTSQRTDNTKTETPGVTSALKIGTPGIAAVKNPLPKDNMFPWAKSDTRNLRIEHGNSSFSIDPMVSVGCAPLKVKFHINSASLDSLRWTFGDGGTSNYTEPEWIFDVEGDYRVIVDLFMHDGRHLNSTASVTVRPRPKAHFEISPVKGINSDDEIRILNYSADAVQFRWDFGDGSNSDLFEPRHTYAKYGNYDVKLVAYSDLGCTDSVTVRNALSASGYYIELPNAFIPNTQGPSGGYYSSKSDEGAQVFHPSFSGVSEFQLKIFSKLGIQIFESNDINLGWDGYNNGQLCEPGVYIWKVRGKFRNGEPFIKMGDVTLLKN